LTLCEPVFGENVRKDPELGDFATMRGMKSAVVVPLRAGFDNFGVMIFASRKAGVFSEEYRSYLQAIGIQTTIALQNAALYQNLYEEKERIVEIEKEARKKLARDLHDGPTQTISAIAMRMSIIRMMLDRTPEEVPAELKKIEELALQTTSEIRLMLYTLRPLALESEGGLTSALEQLADKFEAVYEQHVEVMVSTRAAKVLTESQSETIFSIAQEAVNNARKHAQARTIKVRVTTYEDMVMLEIADNGKGFDVEKQRAAARGRNSLGMQNLTDLANLLDGTLTIDSAPGKGTTITVLSPLDPAGLNKRRPTKPRKRRRDRFQLAAMR
ncbi:MAG: sensor histidine kinase, partial [Chloroflexota bacterium]